MRAISVQIFLSCLLLGLFAESSKADCVLPLPRFRFFAPLIFSKDGTLLPTDSFDEHALTITVPANIDVILSCAPNYFKKPSFNASKLLTARCKENQIFNVNGGESAWLKDLGCEVRPVEESVRQVAGCPTDAISVEFGYENPIKRNTQIIGEACYSKVEGRTLSVHTAFVDNARTKELSLRTESKDYLTRLRPDSRYRLEFLDAARLDDLDPRLRNYLQIEKIPFLEMRHFFELPLMQNGQFNSALKLAWNYVVTNGYDHLPNYDLLMKDINALSEKTLDLYMGTHSILSLKNKNQELAKIYLFPDEKRFQVPEFLWVVVTTESGKGAGFLLSNNIEAKEEDLIANAPCESKCAQMTWMTNLLDKDAYKKPKNGYVLCCDLASFVPAVHEMPALEGKFPLLTTSNSAPATQYETFETK